MPIVRPSQRSFNAGEIDTTLLGRSDIERWGRGLKVCENAIVSTQGEFLSRGGTLHLYRIPSGERSIYNSGSKFIPFDYKDASEAYVWLFGDGRATPFYGGDDSRVTDANSDPYSITIPYTASMLSKVRYFQVGDLIYLFHPDVPPHLLKRIGPNHYNWQLEVVSGTRLPWENKTSLSYEVHNLDSHFPGYHINGIADFDNLFELQSPSATGFETNGIYWAVPGIGTYPTAPEYILNNAYNGTGNKVPFGVSYEGTIYAPSAGTYTFKPRYSSRSVLLINGETVMAQLADAYTGIAASGGTEYTKHLEQGYHSIRWRVVWHLTGTQYDALMALEWKKPGDTSFEFIPARNYLEDYDTGPLVRPTYKLHTVDTAAGDYVSPNTKANFDTFFDYGGASSDHISAPTEGNWWGRFWWHTLATPTGNGFDADYPPTIVGDVDYALEVNAWLYCESAGEYQFAVDSNDSCEFHIIDSTDAANTATAFQFDAGSTMSNLAFFDGAGVSPAPNQHWALQNESDDLITDTPGPIKDLSVSITLPAGWHSIRIRQVNIGGAGNGHALGIGWKQPNDSAWTPIPVTAMDVGVKGYPRLGTLNQNRLVVALRDDNRTFHGSVTDDWHNFTQGTNDDDSYEFELSSIIAGVAADETITNIASDNGLFVTTDRQLLVFRGVDGIIAPLKPGVSPGLALGFEDVAVQPREGVHFLVERYGKRLVEVGFTFAEDRFTPRNMTTLHPQILGTGVTEMTWFDGPMEQTGINHKILWILAGGNLVGLSYERTENVEGFHRHFLAPTDSGVTRVVKSIASIPGTDGDELWLAVQTGDELDVVRFDQGAVYDDQRTATSDASGLLDVWYTGDHQVSVSGSYEGQYTPAAGQITVENPSASYTLGLPVVSKGATLPVGDNMGAGSVRDVKKRWIEVALQVRDCDTLSVYNHTGARQVVVMDAYSGMTNTKHEGYDRDGLIYWEKTLPGFVVIQSLTGRLKIRG